MFYRRCRIHVVCWAAAVAALSLASHVDNYFIDCFIEPRNMGVPSYRCTITDIDLRLVTPVANSTSPYVPRRLKMTWMLALRFSAFYSGLCFTFFEVTNEAL